MSIPFPTILSRPFSDQSPLPEYPMWVSFSNPHVTNLVDVYFGTQFEELKIGVNTTVGDANTKNEPFYRLYLCRITPEGFHWAGANAYFTRYLQSEESLLKLRDWILTNLPSVLMVEALR